MSTLTASTADDYRPTWTEPLGHTAKDEAERLGWELGLAGELASFPSAPGLENDHIRFNVGRWYGDLARKQDAARRAERAMSDADFDAYASDRLASVYEPGTGHAATTRIFIADQP